MAYVRAATVDPQSFASVQLGFRVDKAAATLPATGDQTIFTISGGRVAVCLLFGEVTTAIQNQACNLTVTSTPTTGTAVDLASALNIQADELGCLYLVEGDGTALVGANAGAALSGIGNNRIIVPAGIIKITTSATNTGATKWTCYYVPLDEGASVA